MKKKICLIDYDMKDWGGVEQVIENLALAFQDDFDMTIVSLCNGFSKTYEGIPCETIISERARIREILCRGFGKLLTFLRQNKFDLIIVCGPCAGFVVLLTKPFVRTKYIFAEHLALICEWKNLPIRRLLWFCSKVSDYTVTLTDKNKNDYIQLFHHRPDKIGYIYNWIDQNVFDATGLYDADAKIIITSGRLEYQKGYDRLVQIAEIVLMKHPDWQWDIYGKGTLEAELKKQIGKRGLTGRLRLKGHSVNMLHEYQKYAFFVMTSYYEGLPLVLLEAQANHLPIVSFDIMTGPSEIVSDNKNGFLVKDGNVQEMAEKICLLINNRTLRQNFSAHAYDHIDRFRKEQIKGQWKQLFDRMTN